VTLGCDVTHLGIFRPFTSMQSQSNRPTEWMLTAPRLQIVGESSFAVRAVLCNAPVRCLQLSHLEVRWNNCIWLGAVSGHLVADPVNIPSHHIYHQAERALRDWLHWSCLYRTSPTPQNPSRITLTLALLSDCALLGTLSGQTECCGTKEACSMTFTSAAMIDRT
jgi:hypothetical protein